MWRSFFRFYQLPGLVRLGSRSWDPVAGRRHSMQRWKYHNTCRNCLIHNFMPGQLVQLLWTYSFLLKMVIKEAPFLIGLVWGLNRKMKIWGLALSLALKKGPTADGVAHSYSSNLGY